MTGKGESGLAAEPAKPPRLFVSYSWTNQAHIDWVIQLATDLRAYGVDTIIDRWDLREGQDAHSFMEQSVRSGEVDKTILICDRKYVERANKREGGVGAESQVVTASIYGDVEQTKFVAVVTESAEEGGAALPNFLTSRIFIDFRNTEEYAENLHQLVRWVFDKPLYRKPEIGPRPDFINDQIDFEPIRFFDGKARGHNSNGRRDLVRFLEEAARQKADFTVDMSNDEPNDESVYKAIKALPPVIQQILNEFDETFSLRDLDESEVDALIEYFGKIVAAYEKGPTNWSGDATKFFGQFLSTAIVARALKYRRFESVRLVIGSVLIKSRYDSITAEAIPFVFLNSYLRSMEARNTRLSLRRVSLHSDLITETCSQVGVELSDYMQADLILYFTQGSNDHARFWWPDSLLYAADSHGPLPLFARAVQVSIRDKLMPLIGVANKKELESLIAKIDRGELPKLRWQSAFSSVSVKQLANLEAINSTYGSP